ncbi:MAG: hypothetical protein FWH11_03140 [Micrococcales bacterium]|nr:hypothetical protein [Micrococcales bacterium]
MSTTTIRVSECTRQQVAALARSQGVSQAAYLERLVADQAAAQWEADFWSGMEATPYDDEDRADLAEQEATYDADHGDAE